MRKGACGVTEYLRDNVRLDRPVPRPDHGRGPATAPVTLVEYGDYECPSCGRLHPVISELRERLGDRLRFVFRHFPLDPSTRTLVTPARRPRRRGAQGRFWEMHDLSFTADQDDLGDDALIRLAAELGLDWGFERIWPAPVASRVREDRLGGGSERGGGRRRCSSTGCATRRRLDSMSLLAAVDGAAEGSDRTDERATTTQCPARSTRSAPTSAGVNTKTSGRWYSSRSSRARGQGGAQDRDLFVVGDSDEA